MDADSDSLAWVLGLGLACGWFQAATASEVVEQPIVRIQGSAQTCSTVRYSTRLLTRYNPLLVALHWIMGVMVLVSLAAGGLVLAEMPRESPDRYTALAGHMGAGLVIGMVLIVRLLTRIRSEKPPPATTGNALLDRIGLLTHWGFFVLIAGLVLSGVATAIGAGFFPIVFGSSGEPLPGDLTVFPQRVAHGLTARLLIALHVAAALYHQFVRRDGLPRRMWFGKRR